MHRLLYFVIILIWGTTWIGIVFQSESASPATGVLWRFIVAATVLWITLLARKKLQKVSLTDHFFCMLQGFCVFGINYLFFYTAVSVVNSGLESVIFSMAMFFNAINAYLFFKQKPHPNFIPAACIGLTGIIFLFWRDIIDSHFSLELIQGIIFCLLGTYFFSLGNMVSVRHQNKQLDISSTNCYAMTYGAIIMFFMVLLLKQELIPEFSLTFIAATLYLSIIGTAIAFATYFTLIKRIGASSAAYATLLFPLVALTLSTLLEGYRWNGSGVIGVLLILFGNYLMFGKINLKRLYKQKTKA